MNHEQLKNQIAEKYQKGFQALESVINFSDSFREETNGRTANSVEKIIWMLYSSMFNKISAARILFLEGYGHDASILLRALIENYFDLSYILNNTDRNLTPEVLAERYGRFTKQVIPYQYTVAYKSTGSSFPPNIEALNKKAFEKFMKKYPNGSRAPMDRLYEEWSGKSVRQKAIGGNRLDIYNYTYKILSAATHGGPEHLNTMVREEDSHAVYFVGPTDTPIDRTLGTLVHIFMRALEEIADYLSLSDLRDRALVVENESLGLIAELRADLRK